VECACGLGEIGVGQDLHVWLLPTGTFVGNWDRENVSQWLLGYIYPSL
jgi:hypothetical protein